MNMDKVLDRRRLLSRVLIGGSIVAAGAASVPLIGYLLGPLIHPAPQAWRDVGAVDQFHIGETVGVTYQDPDPLPWSGQTAKSLAWLRRSGEKDFTAFALNCTHLGCPVTWKQEAQHFFCPCHGGVFDAQGKVVGGPPPRPLWRHAVRVSNGRVQIATRSLPIS